ncbi:MAG: SEL1-like repeat protein, partial [Pseudomonadota bacterium]|nr:SEL1-like repeat protein [Pseudomonadota bacterium]
PDNSRKAAEMFGAIAPAPVARDVSDRLPGTLARVEEPARAPARDTATTGSVGATRVSAPAAADARETVSGVAAGSLPPATIGPESLRLAAARGNPAAQYEVGVRYSKGSGVAVDMERASQWLARSAAQGLAPAQFRLASLYERGQGVEADRGKARAWYERAAEQGHVKAMHNLGVMLSSGESSNADYTNAAAWFQRAAQLGLADSQFNLGILYETGLGVEKNPAEAYRWFSTAAARGDREAQKRREQIRTQLSSKMLQQLDQFLAQWRPDQPVAAANDVRPPEGGWSAAAAGQDTSGAADDLVAVAQKLLNTLGYDAGIADGVLGPQTVSAIKRFESRSGQASTGRVTPELVAKLKALAT